MMDFVISVLTFAYTVLRVPLAPEKDITTVYQKAHPEGLLSNPDGETNHI
jgi:hypothetical protein